MKVAGLIIGIILCLGLSAFIIYNIVDIIKTVRRRKLEKQQDNNGDRKE